MSLASSATLKEQANITPTKDMQLKRGTEESHRPPKPQRNNNDSVLTSLKEPFYDDLKLCKYKQTQI